jgi:hypothetical protein
MMTLLTCVGLVCSFGRTIRKTGRPYLQHHPAELCCEQKLLAFSNQGVDDKVLLHIYILDLVLADSNREVGWDIFKLGIPLEPVCMQSTPSLEFFSVTCLDLIEARVSIGLKPEFSARDIGTESSASANALMAYCSRPALYI